MRLRQPRHWGVRVAPSEITAESDFLRRRTLVKQLGLAAGAAWLPAGWAMAAELGPIQRPSPYDTGESLTSFKDASTYNNFYEFGLGKDDPARQAQKFQTRPWTVTVDGECDQPGTLDLDDLLKPHALEERIYRMRCVEAWSMVIPWVGVPLAEVLKQCKPRSSAKYVAFTTLLDPQQMPGQRGRALDWPYREGLRMDEAMHPLTLLAVGMYGRTLPNQNGAPLRLVVPWKYGFKGIKSIVRITFSDRMPATSWNDANAREYGFYANVNPQVDHPRWSQASERRLAGEGSRLFKSRIATLPFNGYAEQVADLYRDMDLRRWY